MLKLKPEILSQRTIPTKLHGVSPRTIKGKDWWNKMRVEVYKKYDYHCIACGVHKTEAKKHKWLEAHEDLSINYKTGICEVKTIEPLCHYCHNFIHTGRLSMIEGKEKTKEEIIEILQHGLNILKANNLKVFSYTYGYARYLGVDVSGIETFDTPLYSSEVEFKLKFEGKKYTKKDMLKLSHA